MTADACKWQRLFIDGDKGKAHVVLVESYLCQQPSCQKLSLFVHLCRDIGWDGIKRRAAAIERSRRSGLEPHQPNDEPSAEAYEEALLEEGAKHFTGRYNRETPLIHLRQWSLIPNAKAKSFPDYVPLPIREDYREACAILELSPKAAATLARRCLQGILRDFYKAKGKNLYEEIQCVRGKFESAGLWKAIDVVRQMGNIGAHMEEDINVITTIDAGEAEALVALIELLIEESYVAKRKRDEKIRKVQALGRGQGGH